MRMPSSSDSPRTLFSCLPSQEVVDHVASVLVPESLLSQPESARADALEGPGQRRDFVAARLLTRLLLTWEEPNRDLTSIADLVLAQSCARCGGGHGRPKDVCGLGVSWAHAGGFVAAAVGPGRVGIDVEPVDPPRMGGLGGATLRAWVRAEAIVKWGHGSLDDALTWLPGLDGGHHPEGRTHVLDAEALPSSARGQLARGSRVVLSDAPRSAAWVCSVAADHPAHWVNPLGSG